MGITQQIKGVRRRILSVLLVLTFIVWMPSSFQLSAFAATTYTPYGTISSGKAEGAPNGPTYYDIYGGAARTIPEAALFYKAALQWSTAKVATAWYDLSIGVTMDQYYSYLDSSGAYGTWTTPVNLTVANSLAGAAEIVRQASVDPGGNPIVTNDVPEVLRNSTGSDICLVTVRAWKNGGCNDYISTIFYGFQLKYLNLAGESASAVSGCDTLEEAQGKSGFTYDTTGSGDYYLAGVKNESATAAEFQQTLSQQHSVSVSDTKTEGFEWGLQEMIGSETELNSEVPLIGAGVKQTFKVEITGTQHWSNSTSKTTTYGDETARTSTVSMQVPAQTVVMLSQQISEGKMEITYDYPVAITFNVMTIYSWAQTGTDGCKIIADFAGDGGAQNNLNLRWTNRSVSGYENLHGNGYPITSWNNVSSRYTNAYSATSGTMKYSFSTSNFTALMNTLNDTRLMSRTGGKLELSGKSMDTTIYGTLPLYPLSKVTTTVNEYKMNTGDSLFVDGIPLTGLNSGNVNYFGFDPSYGHWTLVDSSGNALPTDSKVATLKTDTLTGKSKLVAGTETGTVYLKYLINENSYTYYNAPGGSYTSNANLSNTAIIPVTVTAVQTTHVIGVSLDPLSVVLKSGETQQLTATVIPANASNSSVSYSSSNPGVASVDSGGLVRAAGRGNAIITATTSDGGYTATCNVVVSDLQPKATNNLTMILEADKSKPVIGDDVTYTISLGSCVDVASFGGTILLPPGLTFKDDSGQINPNFASTTGFTIGTSSADAPTASTLTFGATGTSYTGNGLWYAKFTCTVDDTASGNLLPTLGDNGRGSLSWSDKDGAEYLPTVDVSNAAISVTPFIFGDVNGSGTVNMTDVNLIYQHFLGIRSLTGANLRAADVNYSGSGNYVANMTDVNLVYQYFVGKINGFPVEQ